MKNKKTQAIQNNTYITTSEFLNFKKEINDRINNIKEETNNLENKIDKVSDAILNNKTETNAKLELILQKIQKSNINNIKKDNVNKTEEENSEESEEIENKSDVEIKNSTHKKRKKYYTKKDSDDIKEKLRYIELEEHDMKIYLYSLSKYNKKINLIYYYCSDTHCEARVKLSLENDEENKNICISKCNNITIIKEHSIPYIYHNYARNIEIKHDIEILGVTSLVKKCKDYNYLINFIKEIAIKNETLCYHNKYLENYINENYQNIKLDYTTIDKKIIENKINRYKLNNKIKEDTHIDIKDVINLNTICSAISINIRKYNKRNKSLHEKIINMDYKDNPITVFLNVEFYRKKKKYRKPIYLLLTDNVENTLSNSNKFSQLFMDCTCYAIPRNNDNFKLLLLIGFNKVEKKIYLGAIVLK